MAVNWDRTPWNAGPGELPGDREELDLDAICEDCGHAIAKHGPNGCDSTDEDDEPCGCEVYTIEEDE